MFVNNFQFLISLMISVVMLAEYARSEQPLQRYEAYCRMPKFMLAGSSKILSAKLRFEIDADKTDPFGILNVQAQLSCRIICPEKTSLSITNLDNNAIVLVTTREQSTKHRAIDSQMQEMPAETNSSNESTSTRKNESKGIAVDVDGRTQALDVRWTVKCTPNQEKFKLIIESSQSSILRQVDKIEIIPPLEWELLSDLKEIEAETRVADTAGGYLYKIGFDSSFLETDLSLEFQKFDTFLLPATTVPALEKEKAYLMLANLNFFRLLETEKSLPLAQHREIEWLVSMGLQIGVASRCDREKTYEDSDSMELITLQVSPARVVQIGIWNDVIRPHVSISDSRLMPVNRPNTPTRIFVR